jgi:hypothetical protein
VPELTGLATTIETWWPEVLAFLQLRVTNARIEDYNRVTKTIKRVGCGYRNQANYDGAYCYTTPPLRRDRQPREVPIFTAYREEPVTRRQFGRPAHGRLLPTPGPTWPPAYTVTVTDGGGPVAAFTIHVDTSALEEYAQKVEGSRPVAEPILDERPVFGWLAGARELTAATGIVLDKLQQYMTGLDEGTLCYALAAHQIARSTRDLDKVTSQDITNAFAQVPKAPAANPVSPKFRK